MLNVVAGARAPITSSYCTSKAKTHAQTIISLNTRLMSQISIYLSRGLCQITIYRYKLVVLSQSSSTTAFTGEHPRSLPKISKVKTSGCNVSSAYNLESDWGCCSPVDAVAREITWGSWRSKVKFDRDPANYKQGHFVYTHATVNEILS